MTSQLVIFRAFLFIFFRSPNPRSEKKSRKSTNKKNLALFHFSSIVIYLFLNKGQNGLYFGSKEDGMDTIK